MNDRAKNRAIGLIVLIVIIIGPAFFLTYFLNNTGGPGSNKTTRQISIDVGKSQSNAGQNEKRQSSRALDAQSGTKNQQKPHNREIKRAQQKNASENNNGATRHSLVKAQGSSATHVHNPPQYTASHNSAGRVSSANPGSSSGNSSPPSGNTGRTRNSTPSKQGQTHTLNKHQSQGGSGEWAVQVASFKSRKQAKQLISKLSNNYNSFYSTGEVNGTNYFRVRVGPFKTRNQAGKIKQRLEASGYKPYIAHRQH